MSRVALAAGLALAVAACGGESSVAARDALADAVPFVPDAATDSAIGTDATTTTGDAIASDALVDGLSGDDGAPTDSEGATDGAATSDDIAVDTSDAPAPPAVATCPSASFMTLYPPPMPPFPYGDWPLATGCFAGEHDVVIVLGCPSESDGSPSTCQKKRAEMADLLYESGWADHFIVTGAAVHNEWVEADALAALLVGRGVPADAIVKEPLAQHTDENIYYASLIMEARGWLSAIVVSEDPGHLMFTGLCDANCCVKHGRMVLLGFQVEGVTIVKAGHYALAPPGPGTSDEECSHLAALALCVNQDTRKACADDLQVAPP